MSAWALALVSACALLPFRGAFGQDSTRARARSGDSVTIRIAGVELRSAVEIMQQYLDRPVIFAGATAGPQVTLETPRPIARADVPRLLRGLLESQGYELVADSASGTYRARPHQAPVQTRAIERPAAAREALPEPARPSGAPELFVVPLKHARATDVANSINALFGHGGANPAGATPVATTLSDELRANQVPAVDAPVLPTGPKPTTHAATLTGDVTIVPDTRANSLLIRANRVDFELIQSAVQQIDVRPPQVLIEVMIVEARRDRSFALGVDASVAQQRIAHTENSTIGGAFTPGNAGLGDFTLKVMGISGIDVDATISAAVGRGDVKILSRPVVLAANDEQAEVVVGSQRPFVQVSRALPTEDAVRDQVVQYKDVGTKLTVRPTISIDGTVQLNVTQEVSNATTETAFNAPVISTRSIRTDLLAQDGQTIVLGGLTDREHQVQSEGIPILSRIPLLGGFFGRQARTTTETELFVFLTPRVIRSDADAERISAPMRDRAQKVKP
ncbi:MAG TPA: secretin N-terminal domain-containing protein [Gemmatimonadaceae bacterium]|nr:secretin N-terminal domain-containing protein [Gemmatimonadaceae bacterium]